MRKSSVIKREKLSESVFLNRLRAPDISQSAKAGQFFIVRVDEKGERIPLTLSDWNAAEEWIETIYQVAGTTTMKLSEKAVGETVQDTVGPLGKPTPVEGFKRVACMGGGIGIAAVYPVLRAFSEAGSRVVSVLGARTADLIILKDEIESFSDELTVFTDDGSLGKKGLVTQALEDSTDVEGLDLVFAVGPVPMMRAVSEKCDYLGIPSRVSLNSIMLDGTGMCGTCRVEVDGKTLFACVDGPEFDGSLVNWDLLASRLLFYKEEEQESVSLHKSSKCCHNKQRGVK